MLTFGFTKERRIAAKRIVLIALSALLVLMAAQPTYALETFLKENPPSVGRRNVDPLNTNTSINSAKTLPQLSDANGALLETDKKKVERKPLRELTSERDAHTKTFLNTDGTRTMEFTVEQQHYKDGSSWKDIDNTLEEKSDSQGKYFRGDAGLMTGSMKSLSEGVAINAEDKTLTIKPAGARDATPVQKDERTVVYKDVWPGVDIEYQLRGESVKENIIVKNKSAPTTFNFNVDGGQVVGHPTRAGELAIAGLPDEYSFSALTLDVKGRGVISEQRVTQAPTATGIAITLDKDWLKSQPASAFPMRIDPTLTRQSEIQYIMRKSDGYGCNASNCYANTGTIDDNGWKHWRSFIRFDYSALDNKTVLDAQLYGWFQSGAGGTTATSAITIGHASCTTSFNCAGATAGSGNASTNFNIDFTPKLKALVDSNNFSAWWSVRGTETAAMSFKPYYDMRATITYDTPTPMAVASTAKPADKGIVVTTQPSLKVNPVVDADGGTEQYYFRVATNPDAETGAVINSGWITSSQWTIPENILQDGRTYYWHVYTKGQAQTNPNWVRSFKVDMRTGKDSTQAYEEIGPINVDLATGNATTGASTHSISALGGDIGLSLDYNSPAMGSSGLVGQYWNNKTFTGNPILTRTDPQVEFTWADGSPAAGVGVDNFSTRWTGYVTAPATGDYYFGGVVDDTSKIYINGQLHFDRTSHSAGAVVYPATPVHLEGGMPAQIKIEQTDSTSTATMHLRVKSATLATQAVPESWLSTGARQTAKQYGLTGYYYNDPSASKTFPASVTDPSRLLMVRSDNRLAFNWGTGAVSPGLPGDNFLVRWKGFITVPVEGNYTLGAVGDDGIRIKLGTGANDNDETVLDSWSNAAGNRWGTAKTLAAGEAIPITVEYYEGGSGASLSLLIRGGGLAGEQQMPVTWLAPNANVLPDGWELGLGAGDVNYEQLAVSSNNAVLSDSTGQKYEYAWDEIKKAYTSPKDTEAVLTRNTDNTHTLLDTDGKTYIFDADGKLISVTAPEDDRQPAALKYEYAGNPSRLVKIIDGVNENRYGTLHYSGDSACETLSGYNAAPPNYLCAFTTTDDKKTLFQYLDGNLSRVVQPGDVYDDYDYDGFGRIINYRDAVANDAIAYGVRANTAEVTTQITYDVLGRVATVTAPAPTPGANRSAVEVSYLRNDAGGVINTYTDLHTVGAPEPHGFSRRVTYDSLFRTIAETDLSNLTTTTEWDPNKDLVLSTTSPTGLKSTTIYDTDDRPIDSYGPAPADWFDTNTRKPLPEKVNNIPHVQTGYDEGIFGLATSYLAVTDRKPSVLSSGKELYRGEYLMSTDQRFKFIYQTDGNVVLYGPGGSVIWHANKTGVASNKLVMQTDGNLVLYDGTTAKWQSGTNGKGVSELIISNDGHASVVSATNGVTWTPASSYTDSGLGKTSLIGAPLLNKTGLGADASKLSGSWTSSPLPSGAESWGIRMTGKMYLPTAGNWKFRLNSDNGVRMYIDDTLVVNDWNDSSVVQNHPTYTYSNTMANAPHKVTIDYYHLKGTPANTTNASFGLFMTPPGGTETDAVAQYFKPNYGLTTSTTAFDSQLGNMTSQLKYSEPEYGLVSETVLDPTGLNLTASAAYESEGEGFLRQTSKTLPGGTTTQYEYYAANETRDNPCTTETVETALQAGFVKGKTEQDPDGAGAATSITTEAIYDNAGQVVALRTNNDPWTCSTFDERGRPTVTTSPGFDGKLGRTITNNYTVDSTPLKASTTDNSGTITTEVDLLGRLVMYKDAKNNVTNYTYDSLGKLASKTSPIGNETYAYDQYDRLSTYKLDGITYASVQYDEFNRLESVDYQAGLNMVGFERDELQRAGKVTYQAGDTTLSDEITLSTSGSVLNGIENGVTKNYTYDGAGRLTGATIGSDTFAYEFGTPDATCSGVTGNNPNASKSGNRTKYTLNGQSTTYCYDMADRLRTSSDTRFTNVEYDSHGNTVSLGDTDHKTAFDYDANDRNTKITETYTDKTEKVIAYERDVSDRLLRRNYKVDNTTISDTYYGYTADSDSPSFLIDGAGTVVQKYLTLPGGVTVTVKPQSTSAGATTYSLPNMHGDTMATVNADGTATIQAPTGPFGEMLPSSGKPNNTADGASFAYVGSFKKTTDTDLAIAPTQMGARVYIAELGRFLQVDPVEGGTDNNYAYVNDPVNDYDLNGQWGFGDIFKAVKNVVKSVVKSVKKVVVATVKKVVKVAVKVVTAARYVYTHVVKPVVRAVAKTVVHVARAVTKAVKSAGKAVAKVAKNAVKAAIKNDTLVSAVGSLAVAGVCVATGLIACGVATGAMALIGAGISAMKSYQQHKDAGRAAAQGVASLLISGLSFGIGNKLSSVLNVGRRLGTAAVDPLLMPFELGGGKGAEALIDAAYN